MTPKNEQWKHGIGGLAMISDIELKEMINHETYCRDKEICNLDVISERNHRKMLGIVTELKERRESSLRPATKFVGYYSFEEQLEHVKSEIKEIEEAYKVYESNQTQENFIKCLDEITDAQHSLQTLKAIYCTSRNGDRASHVRVIEKNQARGYYCD